MEILGIMLVGVLIGASVFPSQLKGVNDKLMLVSTGLLIFTMGALLGGRDEFLEELVVVGWASVLFCVLPAAFSTFIVYWLTRIFMKDIIASQGSSDAHVEIESSSEEQGGYSEAVLIGIAVVSLLLGVFYGLSGCSVGPLDLLVEHSDFALYCLMFLVGISVGGSRGLLKKMKQYNIRVFVVPFGIVVGSIMGGLLCAYLLGMSLPMGGAIASGLGWYSLAGVVMTDIAGAQIGSISFLSNLMRELLSFMIIPWIARHLNYPTCLAPAAATSEDTTLPMLIKCTNSETVVLAVLNGVICSACVPVLIEFWRLFI